MTVICRLVCLVYVVIRVVQAYHTLNLENSNTYEARIEGEVGLQVRARRNEKRESI